MPTYFDSTGIREICLVDHSHRKPEHPLLNLSESLDVE